MERRSFLLVTVAVLVGCGHGEPFPAPDPWAHGPLVPGAVARLTYSPGRDQSPAWRADGSGVVYTYEDVTTAVRGWCLGVLPAAGGSRVQSRCGVQKPESVEAWDKAAESGDGRVAFVRALSLRSAFVPYQWALGVGPASDPARATSIMPIPVAPPAGPPIRAIGQIAWLDAATLVLLGQNLFIGERCRSCPVDTAAAGRMLYTLPAAGGTPVPVPGTDYATSVAVRGPDEILFTRGGSSLVYRRALAAGVTTPILDLTGQGIVRDVAVAGDRVAVVVGGNVTWGFDADMGDSAQVDGGGTLVVVDLVSGAPWSADPAFPVRRPALAPDGRRAVVETPLRPADLYLVQLP